jgi:hypothetical protein
MQVVGEDRVITREELLKRHDEHAVAERSLLEALLNFAVEVWRRRKQG